MSPPIGALALFPANRPEGTTTRLNGSDLRLRSVCFRSRGPESALLQTWDAEALPLSDVILRHDGEAQGARDAFAALKTNDANNLLAFLKTQVLFPPDDTASTLDPADPTKQNFPQFGLPRQHRTDRALQRFYGSRVGRRRKLFAGDIPERSPLASARPRFENGERRPRAIDSLVARRAIAGSRLAFKEC